MTVIGVVLEIIVQKMPKSIATSLSKMQLQWAVFQETNNNKTYCSTISPLSPRNVFSCDALEVLAPIRCLRVSPAMWFNLTFNSASLSIL